MKKVTKLLFLLMLSIMMFSCCEELEGPYVEGGTSVSSNARNVLIEDFTGHFCPNCPRAARVIEDLEHVYGDKIIPIAVHVGGLAHPDNPPFDLDLRSTTGDELDQEFGCSVALPIGMISRTEFNGNVLVGDGDWPSAVDAILSKKSYYDIKVTTSLDTVNNKLSVNTKTIVLADTTQNINICIYVVESKLIGSQLDSDAPGGEVHDYEFNDVLRTSVNGTFGENIFNKEVHKDETYEKSYSDFSLDNNWVTENLAVVVFLYENTSQEVMQVEYLPLFTGEISNSN